MLSPHLSTEVGSPCLNSTARAIWCVSGSPKGTFPAFRVPSERPRLPSCAPELHSSVRNWVRGGTEYTHLEQGCRHTRVGNSTPGGKGCFLSRCLFLKHLLERLEGIHPLHSITNYSKGFQVTILSLGLLPWEPVLNLGC